MTYKVGDVVKIRVKFKSGSYEGDAKIIRLPLIIVEFKYGGKKKTLCIAECDIVDENGDQLMKAE